MSLRDLYQEVILDHSKKPRNFGVVEGASHRAEGFNPLCGDQLELTLKLDGDTIADLAFKGSGCAISTSSASLMTGALKGKPVAHAHALFAAVHALLTDDAATPSPEVLGKLAVFEGVKEFPTRIKCASLAWHTLKAALDGDGQASTE